MIIKILGISMDHHPTSFFILENEQLGTFWVGKAQMELDECGYSLLPAVTRDQLMDKLESKYTEYTNPCLDLRSINKGGSLPFYGIERWLSKLDYKIKQSPMKLEELKKLLTAGWYEYDLTNNSVVNVLHAINKTDMNVLYKRLIKDWEAKGLRCLNTRQSKTRTERYEDSKKDVDFMYKRARKEVIRQMKKTQKTPKPSTIEKYDIKEDEIKECMGPQGIVYKITCKPTGMSYVGQTVQGLNKRMRQHREQRSYCRYLSEAIKEHNWSNFEVETLWQGNSKLLNDMENKFIAEHNTMAPNGYNLREGGGKSEKVSEDSRQLMIEKQREISLRRGGLLGTITENKSKVDGRIISWSLKGHRDGKHYTIANCKTKEEALEVQREFTNNPDTYEIPKPTRVANGMALCIYYDKERNKWYVNLNNTYLGRYDSKEEAEDALKRYKEDPDNFTRPNKRDPNRDDMGVTFKTNDKKWQAYYHENKKSTFLGLYTTKQEAIDARKRFIEDPENFTRPNQRKKIIL
jgi:group I intron endonuclease